MTGLHRREDGHVTVLSFELPSGERREVEVSGRRLRIIDHVRGKTVEGQTLPWVLVKQVQLERSEERGTVSLVVSGEPMHIAFAVPIDVAVELHGVLEAYRKQGSGRSPMSARRVLQQISRPEAVGEHREWHPAPPPDNSAIEESGSIVVRSRVDHAEVTIARAGHRWRTIASWGGVLVAGMVGLALLPLSVAFLARPGDFPPGIGLISLSLAGAALALSATGLLLTLFNRAAPATTLLLSQHGVKAGDQVLPWSQLESLYLDELGGGHCAVSAITPEGRVLLVDRMSSDDVGWLVTRIEMARPDIDPVDDAVEGEQRAAERALFALREKAGDR